MRQKSLNDIENKIAKNQLDIRIWNARAIEM